MSITGFQAPESFSDHRSSIQASRLIAILGLIAVAAFLGLTLTGEWDAWWHLQIGRVALTDSASLSTDPFSYSFANTPWPYKDLVADVILYAGYSVFGLGIFAILKALLVLSVAGALILVAKPDHARLPLLVLLSGLAIAAIQYRFTERPILFTLALFPLHIALLERLRLGLDRQETRIFFSASLPTAVLFLWTLLHREAIVGIVFTFIYLAASWGAQLQGMSRLSAVFGPRVDRRRLAIASLILLSILPLSLLNPCGLSFYTSTFAVAGDDTLRELIADWHQLSPSEYLLNFPVTVVLAVSALSASVFSIHDAWRNRQVSTITFVHPVMIVSLVGLCLRDSVRWIPELSLYSAIVLGLSVSKLSTASRLITPFVQPRTALIASAIATVGMVALIAGRSNFEGGIGPIPDRFAQGAIDFAKKNRLGPKMINSFHQGGYAIWAGWPQFRVLVDGRNDIIYPPAFIAETGRAGTDPAAFEKMVKTYGGDWVLASNHPNSISHSFLFRDPRWMMIYWSEPAVIYVRRKDYPALSSKAFQLMNPAAIDLSVANAIIQSRGTPAVMAQLQREIDRMLEASPTSLRANAAAAIFFHFSGPAFRSQRDQFMKRLNDLYGDHPDVIELKRRFSQWQSDPD